MTNLPSLRYLQYLSALAHYKSFSRAAAACFVTQSTLSSGIKELEVLLGQPVAERSSRVVRLTPFGQEILKQSEKVLQEAAQLVQLAKRAARPMSGPLRLGIIPTIAPYWLPSALQTIKSSFPDLELRLSENMTHILLQKLETGQIDAAVIAFPYPTAAFERRVLFRDPFVLACAAQKAGEKWKEPLPLSILERTDLLVLEDGHCLRDHVLEFCKLGPRAAVQTFQITSLLTLIELVRQGYGATLLPDMVVVRGGVPDDIRLFSFQSPAPFREIGVIWRKQHPLAEDITCLIETLS
ncbi:MAG: LysR family transcriptional regulator [Rhodospirillales bacterium]|nr:LysR family transcriptional regulator [Rhodospirillales bacterium]MCB9964536.1 LysR family transcriptional regulator [Rhodospirillales bacterium]MCB9973809.1 LysR family transcriptional regulator [Rhodospirillales bacterium]MCB9980307.1 LysR family transcriptional regulator [Rhodospirillales bacterium]